MKRLLITGSRDWADRAVIEEALFLAYRELSDQSDPEAGIPLAPRAEVVLVSGHCPTGADAIAEEIWEQKFGLELIDKHPADWARYGRAAGPKRNSKMVALGADLCLAFFMPNSRGTVDCAGKAEAAGIEVRKFYS